MLTDANGDAIERYRYDLDGNATILDPDGNELATLNGPQATGNRQPASPYLFTGRRLDPETGLYYFGNRYYSTLLGKFISPDPLDYVDGMNVYAYVNGNAANAVDPMGTDYVWVPKEGTSGQNVKDGKWVWVPWRKEDTAQPMYDPPMIQKPDDEGEGAVPKPGSYFGQRYRRKNGGKGEESYDPTSKYDRLFYEVKEVDKFGVTVKKSIYEVFLSIRGEGSTRVTAEQIKIWRETNPQLLVALTGLHASVLNDKFKGREGKTQKQVARIIARLSGCSSRNGIDNPVQLELLYLHFGLGRSGTDHELRYFDLVEAGKEDPRVEAALKAEGRTERVLEEDCVFPKTWEVLRTLLGMPNATISADRKSGRGTLPIGLNKFRLYGHSNIGTNVYHIYDRFDFNVTDEQFADALNAFFVDHMPANGDVEDASRNISGTIVTGIMRNMQDVMCGSLEFPTPFQIRTIPVKVIIQDDHKGKNERIKAVLPPQSVQ